MPRPAPFSPPAQIEEYTIVRPLGRGAMGQVYLAHDTLLDRPVALKFIAGPEAEKLEPGGEALGLRERFFVEARAIARLSHPNVVAIFRVGEWRGRPYLVSELVRGESLDRLPRPQPQERVIELGLGLCRGLAAAHRRGVLHRDIKPANAMLTRDGEVKLLDFGLAKLLEPTIAALSASHASLQPLTLPITSPVAEAELGATRPGREREELAATRGRPSEPQPRASEPSAQPPSADAAATADTLLAVSRGGDSDAGHLPPTGSAPDRDSPSLTQHGDVLGSPLYMAPELWRGEPATRAADIYSLGTLLYELCAGRAPHDGLSLLELPLRCMETDVAPLSSVRPEIDARLAAVIDRCLRREPAQRFDSADALREALEELRARATSAPHIDGNPYRGLQSFEPHHSGLFFGRDAEIRAVLDRLRGEALLVVTGDSGVGKSSLCRAGVLAAIESGSLGPRHRVAAIAPGRRPLGALASALAPLLGRDEAPLHEELAAAPQEIARELRRRNRGPSPSGPLVLFVDQMEELFTQSPDPEQEAFGRALRELCGVAPDVRVLVTVRSDFLSRLAALPGLGPEVGRALFLLGPLAPDGLRESITRPAAACGFRFETPALVDGLVRAAARAPGGLPLLSFTLSKLWDARDVSRRLIPAQALEQLGGLGGALARHADGVLSGMLPAERQVARRVLGLLVTAEGTRARRSRRELGEISDSAAAGAMEALIRGRIVTVHASDEGEGQIELAHEILLSSWGTLRGWLAKDAEQRAARQRLSSAAAEWQRLGRSRELLWTRLQLAEAAALPLRELPVDEAAFLSASRGAVRARRLRWALLIFGAPLAVGLLYLAAQIRASRDLRRQIDEQLGLARSEQRVASALNADAERIRQDALIAFDARKKEEGEKLWDRMLAQDTEARQSYRRASKAAEAAFMLGSKRSDVRDTLAEILSERALISERNHFFGNRDELLGRVWLFDRDGSYKRRWFAPAQLSLTTDPPEAEVSLIAIDEQHRSHSEAALPLGQSPVRGVEIEPGAYLMELRAPDRLLVRYPISLSRGEKVALTVRLPRPEEIPPGFIYVPAGRTLFGSDADDSQRRDFFYHVPIHPVQTDSYLIARHETTYAEWIEYLRALPPEERSRRLPRAGQPGISGTLQLKQRPPSAQPAAQPEVVGFELVLQPTVVAYSALEGEPLRITAPKRKQSLDWSRLPVTGVSSEDAEAYVGWLRRSGRVTGARLCTEIEWERAARGADERHYPHGDQLLPADASWDQTYGQDPAAMGPDVVGSHPASRSILGVEDLAGNAFEWVRNSVSDKPYALRGGAYYYGSRTCRIDNRYEAEPTMRNPTVGVRVCATLAARQP